MIYETKCGSRLFVGKIQRWFLQDESGHVDCVEVHCPKPKVGSGTVLEDTPTHLPDISVFSLVDVIYGPLEVVPLKGEKFNVPQYQQVVEHFNCVNKIKRNSVL